MFTITITFREETYVKRFSGAAQVSFDLHYSSPLYARITILPRKKGNLIDRAFIITVAHLILRDQFIPKMEKCTAFDMKSYFTER